MERKLTLFYTADSHGALPELSRCGAMFKSGGSCLKIDGGDTLQGSPLMYYLCKGGNGDAKSGAAVAAQVMNAVGYDFVTLGNHDFSFGKDALEEYLGRLDAVCLCANVSGLSSVRKTALVTLENGLRVGLTGITSPLVPKWEPEEHVSGLTFTDAYTAAADAFADLAGLNPDITVCIYHGGYETAPDSFNPVADILPEEDFAENQGLRMARDIGFDVLLTSHQHMAFEGREINGTFTCQTPDKCGSFIKLEMAGDSVSASLVHPGEEGDPEADAVISPRLKEMQSWLGSSCGTLDVSLEAGTHIESASHGSLLANFFNQVQLEVTGADISCTSLSNSVSGIPPQVTNRSILLAYPFPNTLKVIEVNRSVLKSALERCAGYFAFSSSGALEVSSEFTSPSEQHYNYDYFSGIDAVIDPAMPGGQKVVSMKYNGRELDGSEKLTLCLNNYRASGAGGYPFYADCPVVSGCLTEIPELIMDYVKRHGHVEVDKHKWLTVIGADPPGFTQK